MKFSPDSPSRWLDEIKHVLRLGRMVQRTAAALNFTALGGLLFWTFLMAQNQPYEIPLWHIALFAFLIVMFGTNTFLFFLLERYGSRREMWEGASRYDDLTGALSPAGFQEAMDREIRSAGRYHYPVTLCLIDLDDFRSYNETFGHEKGNHLLKTFGLFLRGTVRFSDSVSRYEKDEFLVMLPHTDLVASEKFLQRIQILSHERVDASFSAGVTSYRAGESPSQFLERSKIALGEAKREGSKKIRCVIGNDDAHIVVSF